MSQPLNNKKVLVTRPLEQAREFITQLHNVGAQPVLLPLIQIAPSNQKELPELYNSSNFNWIIFTSVNAVIFFFKLIDPNKISSKIAVVGDKTKKAVENLGLEVNFTPSKFTATTLATELSISKGDSIIIPRSEISKETLVESLIKKGAKVFPISIYKNQPLQYSKEELKGIFNGGIDFITFTSGSTVESFINLPIQLDQEKIICIGPETAKVAQKLNLKVTAIADPHNTEGMIQCMKKN